MNFWEESFRELERYDFLGGNNLETYILVEQRTVTQILTCRHAGISLYRAGLPHKQSKLTAPASCSVLGGSGQAIVEKGKVSTSTGRVRVVVVGVPFISRFRLRPLMGGRVRVNWPIHHGVL